MSTQSDPNKVLGALQIGSTKLNATAHINRQCKDNNGSVKIIMEVNLTRTYRDNNVQCENSTKEPAIVNLQIKGNLITHQRKCISSIPYVIRTNPNRIRYVAKFLHDLKKKQ